MLIHPFTYFRYVRMATQRDFFADRKESVISRRPTYGLLLLMLLVGGYRMTLIDRGHFYDFDERSYLQTTDMIEALSRGEYRVAVQHLFLARGDTAAARPGYVVVSLIPAAMQRVAGSILHIDRNSQHYYDACNVFNVLVSVVALWLLYELGAMWTGSRWFGLLAAGVFSATWYANMWVCHLVSYHASLALFLAAMVLVGKHRSATSPNARFAPLCGLLTGLGFASYPGYYALLVINSVAVAALMKPRVRAMLGYAAGGLTVFLVFELAAWFAGRSYLGDMLSLSDTIRQGDFAEGFLFGWRYLLKVEGALGMLLLITVAWLPVHLCRHGLRSVSPTALVVIPLAVLCYFVHGAISAWAEHMVFYGRVFGAFIPLLVCGSVTAVAAIRHVSLRRFCVFLLVATSMVQFVLLARAHRTIQYPADFLFQTFSDAGVTLNNTPSVLLGIATNEPHRGDALSADVMMVSDALPEGSDPGWLGVSAHHRTAVDRPRFICANLRWVPYVGDQYAEFQPPHGYRLIASAAAPWSLPAYRFEGRRPWERRRLAERGYSMRVYERSDSILSSR